MGPEQQAAMMEFPDAKKLVLLEQASWMQEEEVTASDSHDIANALEVFKRPTVAKVSDLVHHLRGAPVPWIQALLERGGISALIRTLEQKEKGYDVVGDCCGSRVWSVFTFILPS